MKSERRLVLIVGSVFPLKYTFKKGEAMKAPTRFLTNEKGERLAVIIEIEEYEKLLEEFEDAQALVEYHEAKASGETAIPLDQALGEIRRNRK
jgi:hypothetical protein